ncbi:unnamed protein product [Phytophthora fragariaefolia]|uniref:RxLR effector protein n=1 Tax=Phytophthora fragariaefolia TaxID=1490495 RepID=A0A9W6Y4B5_9STRA|nr:unnamed protein product [Phytophthora fragariaefolia]
MYNKSVRILESRASSLRNLLPSPQASHLNDPTNNPTMRLNYVFFAAAVIFASCNFASASKVVTADGVQLVDTAAIGRTRSLRTTETVKVKNIEDEERIFENIIKLISGARFVGKVSRKDGTFTDKFVRALVTDQKLRKKNFDDWVVIDPDATSMKILLGPLTSKDRVLLMNLYTIRTGAVVHQSGNKLY